VGFVRVPGNPEPAGAEELWLEGRGGVKLRALIAPASGQPRGSVILFAGRTEFIEKYFEVICELQQRGFAVFTMDWRGQGLSGREQKNPLKGHFATFDDPVNDLYTALRLHGDRLPKPHIVLAHSMGGCIALRAMQTNRLVADGAVFSAPMWGIANVRGFAEDFTRFMSSAGMGGLFAPGVETKWKKQSFKKNALTHDKERYARAQGLVGENMELALAGPTFSWVTAALDAIETFHQPGALNHLRMPIMVMSAGEEQLVDNASHAELATLLPNARHIMIEGARHEIMMETDDLRAQFWAAFDVIADAVAPRAGVAAQQAGA
jgi:lysophospholipase